MRPTTNQTLYIFLIALGILLIYLLAPIMTPFLLGALLAYLMDPLVKYLEKKRIPHLLSVSFVFLLAVCFFLLLILMMIPLIQKQISTFLEVLPQILDWIQNQVMPRIQEVVKSSTLNSTLTANLPKAGTIIGTVVTSGYAVIFWIIYAVLTPVVTFYLLRDWDMVLSACKNILPHASKATIIQFAKECDEILSGFFRGQLLVMLGLAIIYGIGLTIIGLKIGPLIGILGGLLSIVPYLGSLFVLTTASIAALVQFGTPHAVLWVLGVFLIGQIVEGYILTPYLVGRRIGLHPVAVIFSVMAGGMLFGFFGVLLALPITAVIKAFIRFLDRRYHLRQS